jgi:hypothetical protein
MNGSPDRHRGRPFAADFGCRSTNVDERLMNGRDQCSELIGPDLVPANIRGDNRRSEFSIK